MHITQAQQKFIDLLAVIEGDMTTVETRSRKYIWELKTLSELCKKYGATNIKQGDYPTIKQAMSFLSEKLEELGCDYSVPLHHVENSSDLNTTIDKFINHLTNSQHLKDNRLTLGLNVTNFDDFINSARQAICFANMMLIKSDFDLIKYVHPESIDAYQSIISDISMAPIYAEIQQGNEFNVSYLLMLKQLIKATYYQAVVINHPYTIMGSFDMSNPHHIDQILSYLLESIHHEL